MVIYKQQNPDDATPDVPKDVQEDANAQVNLMGDAAVDPQNLMDEEKDPIAQEIKNSKPADRKK